VNDTTTPKMEVKGYNEIREIVEQKMFPQASSTAFGANLL